MPLSEHEQRLLSEMEQRLVADDPRFASTMRGAIAGGRSKPRLAVGALAVVVGLGVMLAALYWELVPVAIVGFVIMLAGMSWAFAPTRKAGPQGIVKNDGKVQRQRKPAGQSFLNRMEQRWDRRRQDRP